MYLSFLRIKRKFTTRWIGGHSEVSIRVWSNETIRGSNGKNRSCERVLRAERKQISVQVKILKWLLYTFTKMYDKVTKNKCRTDLDVKVLYLREIIHCNYEELGEAHMFCYFSRSCDRSGEN